MEQTLSTSLLSENFPQLNEVLTRYRRSVHQLFPPASSELLSKNILRLGIDIPSDLYRFYQQHNGGELFRNLLSIRPIEQLASASVEYPQVVLFAEGPRKEEQWAFIKTERGEFVYGIWQNREFVAMHSSFSDWLNASIRILDEGISNKDRQISIRRSMNEKHPFFIMERIEQFLGEGDIEPALSLLSLHYRKLDQWPRALVLYADCIRIQGGCSAPLYVRSLEQVSLPSPYPTYLPMDFDFLNIRAEESLFTALKSMLEERLFDITNEHEARFVEYSVLLLMTYYRKNNQRSTAKKFIQNFLTQAVPFSYKREWLKLKLLLCDILIELGEHDEADTLLRSFLSGDKNFDALLRLGEMAILRQEPFANQILDRLVVECTQEFLVARAQLAQAEGFLYMRQVSKAVELLHLCETTFRRMNHKDFVAKVLMFRGDIAVLEGSIGGANRQYQLAMELAILVQDEETRCRIWERQTDLLYLTKDNENARQTFQVIADCFDLMELPVRKSWVCLKQGLCGDNHALHWARKNFQKFDIASGVGHVDQVLGTSIDSIHWHIDGSQKYAQLRLRALRGVSPYTRQDSERFERRIASHRKAISDLDDSVVDILSGEMIAIERDLAAVPASSFSYSLSRYIALCNLLVSHRSYKAAERLFSIIEMERPLSAPTRRVLVDALCRSRNMILIDGLLRMVTEQKTGMGIAAEVLGYRKEKQAVQPLIDLLSANVDTVSLKSAIYALGLIGDKRAVSSLLISLSNPELAEESALSLLLLGEWKGLDEKAQFLVQPNIKGSRILGEMVGRYGGPSYFLLLKQALDGDSAKSLGACMGLGYLGDPRIIPELIDRSGSRNPKIAAIASCALEIITGHFETSEEPLLRPRWQTWWDRNSGLFKVGYRYRFGKPMEIIQLIEQLKHDSREVRQAAYDELVISTGVSLPFDVEGPWRVQQTHLFAWQSWWKENQDRFPMGSWFFHGEKID